MFKICLLLMTPSACQVPIAMFLKFSDQVVIQNIWSVCLFLNNITITAPLKFINLFFQLFTDVLIKLCLGYFNENVLMAKEVPNIDACFPTSLSQFLELGFDTA